MKTLREKFSCLQKKRKKYYKWQRNINRKKLPLLNQMSFLNTYIQEHRLISLQILIISTYM